MTRLELIPVSTWPLVARLADIAALPNGWQLLVVADGQQEKIARQLSAEYTDLTDQPVVCAAVTTARELEDLSQRDRAAPLFVWGFDKFDAVAWRSVDIARSRLERSGQTLLVVSQAEVERIPSLAPNLWSWIGDGVWTHTIETGLSDDERTQRLEALRAHFGFDDDELLRRVQAGTLPLEPDIAEWMILLGHGDLLHSGSPAP